MKMSQCIIILLINILIILLWILRWNMTCTHSWQVSADAIIFNNLHTHAFILWSWHKLCAWYFFLFLIDKAYHPYIYMWECIGGFRVCAVVFGTGRADSGMLGDLALRFYCSIGCIQGRRSSQAGKLGEPVTQQTHTKFTERTHLSGLSMQNLPV